MKLSMCIATLLLTLALGACTSDDTSQQLTDPDQDLAADDSLWGEEFGMGASQGAVMTVDDDIFRLGVISVTSTEAKLDVLHSTDRTLNRVETVQQGSRFIVGDYRIRVGTVASDGVVALWSKRISE